MPLRPYRANDAAATRAVFERAVAQTAAGDYTAEQRTAWAPHLDPERDADALVVWAQARAAADTIVAVDETDAERLVGFADLIDGSLLDMLYVDPSAARRGVGSALIERIVSLASEAGADAVHTYASVTARPLLERHGFVVAERRTPVVRGVAMTNFAMRRRLQPRASFIAHAGLPFANPVSPEAIEAAIATLGLPSGASVLDVGCGRGELLIQTLRRWPSAHGLGVDLDADAIAVARCAVGELPARFTIADAATVTETFDLVLCVGAAQALGGFPDALAGLRRLAPRLVYGEGFWRRPPSADFLAALGGADAGELADLPGLHAAVAAAGFTVQHEWRAGDEDWARYEESLADIAERAGTPETAAYARRIRERRALPDGTDTLGFALLVLRA